MKYKKYIANIFLAALLALIGTAQAYAVGLGFSFGAGTEEWEDDLEHQGDREISNVGFLVDTAVARNKIFNYRFTFLKEDNKADSGLLKLDMEGYAMTHDFGFGVLRTKHVRLWVGPQLKASFYDDLYSNNLGRKVSGDVFGFGIGPVMGVNVHLPQVVTFSFSAVYYIISGYSGDYDQDGDGTVFFDDHSVDAESNGLALTASLIFRINE